MARIPKKMPAPPNQAAMVEENPEAAPQPHAELDGTLELDAASEPMPEPPKPAPLAAHKRKIKVVALQAGFIHQHRKVQGDKFEMTPAELEGAFWVKCEDPIEQKKHFAACEAKRNRVNLAAIKEDEAERAANAADE